MASGVVLAVLLLALPGCDNRSEAELVASAKVLLDDRDVSGAMIQLKNALDKNPDSAAVRLLLGKALLQNGDPAAALIELRKARAAQAPDDQVLPEIARAMLAAGESARVVGEFADTALGDAAASAELKTLLATAYASRGELSQARDAAAAALQSQPGHAPATVLLARLDASAGDIDTALRQLDEVLARDAGNEGAGLLKGEILVRARNDPDTALAVIRQVRTAHPQSVAAQVALVNLLAQQKKGTEARTEFAQLQKIGPRHPDTLFLQAQFAFDDKDYKASREITERLLAPMPDNVRVLMLAAAAEVQMQQYTLAEGLLGRALKLAPGLPMARHLLAQTLLRTAAPDKAIEVLQPLLESPKADATSLALAGEAYLQAGDARRAEEAFQRALKAAPEDARLRTSLAMSQLAQGDSGPAISQLEAIAKGDSGTQADLALLSARLRQNDLKGALKAIDGLGKKLPDRAYPQVLRGRVLLQQGDKAGAAASFEKALAREPADFAAIAGLAGLEFSAGKPEMARKRFEALLEADPRHVRAKLALAELDAKLGAPDAVVAAQLRDASKVDPSQVGPHLVLIDRLLASGDAQGALVAAQDAAAALPNDVNIMDALGRAQMAAGDSQRAVSTFKKLAALQPKKAIHQVRLADAHMIGKDRASAASALRQALEIEPDNLLAQRGLALLAVLDKRPQDGIAIARSIQKRLPKATAGFALEGELEAMGKNWGAAADAYAAALQRDKSTDLATRLHRCLSAGGKAVDAERMAAGWRKSHPDDAAFIYYLGDQAAAAKDWPRAEALFRDVVALQPRHATAMNNVAWLLATQRKPGATAMAERALALLPERAPLLDTLALALEVDNQLPRAVEVQKRATELDPKSPMLRLRLAQLLIKHGDKSDARKELEALARLGSGFAAQDEVAALLKTL